MQDLSTQVAHHFRRDTVVYKDVCIRLAMRVWNTRPVQASGAVQVQLRKGEKKERSQTRGGGGCPLLTKARGKGEKGNVKKARRITKEEEGSYKVIMPQKKTSGKKGGKSPGGGRLLDRLGAGNSLKSKANKAQSPGSGILERLGGGGTEGLKHDPTGFNLKSKRTLMGVTLQSPLL